MVLVVGEADRLVGEHRQRLEIGRRHRAKQASFGRRCPGLVESRAQSASTSSEIDYHAGGWGAKVPTTGWVLNPRHRPPIMTAIHQWSPGESSYCYLENRTLGRGAIHRL